MTSWVVGNPRKAVTILQYPECSNSRLSSKGGSMRFAVLLGSGLPSGVNRSGQRNGGDHRVPMTVLSACPSVLTPASLSSLVSWQLPYLVITPCSLCSCILQQVPRRNQLASEVETCWPGPRLSSFPHLCMCSLAKPSLCVLPLVTASLGHMALAPVL